MQPDYNYNPKRKKALAKVLRSTTASMGHAMSAYNSFTKIKSADVSPDGNLGGKGYIQKIMDMRKQYMNVVEALSALSDTIYDEINAPHWAAISRQESEEDKKEVAQIIQDAEEIKEDPEGWAEEQEEEMDEEHTPITRTASSNPLETIFKLLQRQFGSARRWHESGFEDGYMSIEGDTLYAIYTTGLRGDAQDDYELEDRLRLKNKKAVEAFLKRKGYSVTVSWEDPALAITLKGRKASTIPKKYLRGDK
jgi:hypothetical protein